MTTCITCGKDLSKVKEIHAVRGLLFCSKVCAVEHLSKVMEYHEATQTYTDCHEIVTPEDIGLKED